MKLKLRWLFPTWRQFKNWSLPSKLSFYGTYLGVISLGLTVVIFFNSEAIRDAIVLSSKRQALTGSWEAYSENPETKPHASLLISGETEGLIQFDVSASNGGHTCSAEGFALLENGAFVFSEDVCRMVLQYDHRSGLIDVQYNYECQRKFCGMRAGFAWQYERVVGYFEEVELLNSIEDVQFRKLVKGRYGLFRNNMTSWSEPIIDRNSGLFVVSGMAPDLAMSNAAIIAKDRRGKIAAATIDYDIDRILYFSNHPTWQTEIPSAIQEWASRFEMELVAVDYSY